MLNQEEKIITRDALPSDAPAIADIYNYYITRTIITFEEEVVSSGEIENRIEEVRLSSLPWLVLELDGGIVGYAYAGRWKGRCAYRFSTEITVYVHPDHVGCGFGLKLYTKLLLSLKSLGIHVAIGGIALPNDASIGLHEKLGFIKVAQFKEVGYKFNQWIDVGYWQLIL